VGAFVVEGKDQMHQETEKKNERGRKITRRERPPGWTPGKEKKILCTRVIKNIQLKGGLKEKIRGGDEKRDVHQKKGNRSNDWPSTRSHLVQ